MEIPDGGGGDIYLRFALERYSDEHSKEVNQDLRYRAHGDGGYLGHHVHYVEDQSLPQNREA